MMYVELLKEFQLWNPGLVKMMKECSHHFSPTDINPYHVEDDVWTHTLLAYNQLVNSEHYTINCLGMCLATAVLCHDIGKVYTRHSPSPGKISMYNHAFAGIQDTYEFTHLMWNKGIYKYMELSDVLYYVLSLVSNHMDYMINPNNRNKLCNNRNKLCNNNSDLKKMSDILLYCDKSGSFSTINDYSEDVKPKNYIFSSLDNELGDIILVCGPPASGKDTIAKEMGYEVVSLDKIRLEKYIDSFTADSGVDTFDYKDKKFYKDAFEYCNKNKIDLNAPLLKKIKEVLDEGKRVAVCNTHLTRKSRRSIINQLRQDRKYKNEKISALFLCCDRKTLYKRDEEREDKTVSKQIIDKFVYNQQVPTINEGFDNIKFFYNG